MNRGDISRAIEQVESDMKSRARRSKYPATLGLNGLICAADFFDTASWRSQLSQGLLVDAQARLAENQFQLLDSTEQCSAVCALLGNVKRTKQIDRETITSYWCYWCGELEKTSSDYGDRGKLHSVYGEWGKPSYGMFIAAAVHCGVAYAPREAPYSFQCWFGLSSACMSRLRWMSHLNPNLFQRLVRGSVDTDPEVRCDAKNALATRRAFDAEYQAKRAAAQ